MARFGDAQRRDTLEEGPRPAARGKRWKPTPGIGAGGPKTTEAEWAEMFALISAGHSFRDVARRLNRHERHIRRVYHEGLPRTPWGATPIRVLLEQKREAAHTTARAERARTEPDPTPLAASEDGEGGGEWIPSGDLEAGGPLEDVRQSAPSSRDREDAAKDALGARTAEARLVKLVRGDVEGLAGAVVAMLGPLQHLGRSIATKIALNVKGNKIDPAEGLGLIRETVRIVKDLTDAGKKAMEMERLLLGDPSGGGARAQEAAAMTDDDLAVELTNMEIILSKLHPSGLRVIEGGHAGEALDTASSHAAATTSSEPEPTP